MKGIGRYIVVMLVALLTPWMAEAQSFQPLNAGFEQWDGSAIDAEPTHWNSFATSDGSYASMASSPHHYHRHGGRPGSDGASYLTIYTKSILGIKANGNMTTGRIHAGSMSATNPNNYNYTQRNNADHSQPFSATPDSVYVWVSYHAANTSSQASITCVIHGDSDFQDPNHINDTNLYCGKAVFQFHPTSNDGQLAWTELRAPFEYSGVAEPAYLLISMSSNMLQGGGAAKDSLSIDDFRFVYSAWISSLSINGSLIDDFAFDRMGYSLHLDSMSQARSAVIDYATQSSDATVTIDTTTLNDTTFLYTLHVLAEDAQTERIYTITIDVDAPEVIPDDPDDPDNPDVCVDSPMVESVLLHPNPTSSWVEVACLDANEVAVFDLKGHKIEVPLSFVAPNSCLIDVRWIPEGVYLVWIKGHSGKLIVRH